MQRLFKNGLGLLSLLSLTRTAASFSPPSLQDCLTASSIPLDTPDSVFWNLDILPFNSLLPYTPAAVAVPTSTPQIQAAIACGVASGYKVSARCGGHSYGSYGLGGEDGHLVIQLDRMYTVTLDMSNGTQRGIATAGPGTRLGHLASELWTQGGRAIAHGTCPGVGTAGHALHGGFGISSHTHGLALDWISGLTVALANGSLVHCSATENTDLFWGMLGAGSNFGIVTEFEWNTFAPPSNLTWFSADLPWGLTAKNGKNVTIAGLEAVGEFATSGSMPPELNMRVVGTSVGATQLEGLYYGDETELYGVLAPLLNVTGASLSQVQPTDWIGSLEQFAGTTNLDITWPYSSQETFHSNGLVLKSLKGQSAEDFVDYWFSEAYSNTGSGSWYFQLDIQGGNTSAVTTNSKTGSNINTSSYAHRDKLYILSFFYQSSTTSVPSDAAAMIDGWAAATTQSLSLENGDWGMYINYPDLSLNRTMAQELYFGESLPRLKELKALYDPDEVFYYPVSVDPATGSGT
ncbi:Glucooligosaccharide oxidase [Xylariaceae sp. FL0255]|nr:Glucooligosaccharide oxidase [Xylariaceae sp. FL0255]